MACPGFNWKASSKVWHMVFVLVHRLRIRETVKISPEKKVRDKEVRF